jgi:uncharacterized protein (DUF1015 family)
MATILPFKAIRPNPLYADQLVFTKPQAESVSGDYTKEGGLKPLKTLLETGARLRPETPEGQELAYSDIKETLQSLLEKDQLHREELPGIYIYEVVHQTYRQTGIWTLTPLDDYRQGRIKIHELTFADSIRRMRNYRENTGLEGSPILLTYFPTVAINNIIDHIKATQPKTALGNQNGIHRIWKIRETETQQALINAFAQVGTVYMADGHHRIESAALSSFSTISSLYMATDQLRIEEYDRVVIPDSPIEKAGLVKRLEQIFYIKESTGNRPVRPTEQHRMGMYFDGEWHHLLVKEMNTAFGAELLQEQVLSKIFGINDPKTDSRLKCAGGEKALEEIGAICQAHPGAIAFRLSPLTVAQLVAAADAGRILPPKSTWIIPKVPYGLLIHQHPLHDERT